MKKISNFINEKLNLSSKNLVNAQYEYCPTSTAELKKIILKEIKKQGNAADLNMINTSKITDMKELFSAFPDFCGDVSLWNVSNVTDMSRMFAFLKDFNCDISGWDVSNVKDMCEMFYYCKSFNQDLNSWNVSNVTSKNRMFTYTVNLTQKPDWFTQK